MKYLFLVIAILSCGKTRDLSSLKSETYTVTNNGFRIAGWNNSPSENSARGIYEEACKAFQDVVFSNFDPTSIDGFNCGGPANMAPGRENGRQFYYVSQPTFVVRSDSEPKKYLGSEITFDGTGSSSYPEIIRSATHKCLKEIAGLRARYGKYFIAGNCGDYNYVDKIRFGEHYVESFKTQVTYWLRSDISSQLLQSNTKISEITPEKSIKFDRDQAMHLSFDSKDARFGYSANFAGSISKFDFRNGVNLWHLPIRDENPNTRGDEWTNDLALPSPRGSEVAFGGIYGYLELRRADTGALIRELNKPFGFNTKHYQGGSFSSDSRFLLTIASTSDNPNNSRIQDHNSERFPTSRQGVAEQKFGTILEFWETETGRIVSTFKFNEGFVHSAGFSPDGQKIIVVLSNAVKILRADNGEPIQTIPVTDIDNKIRFPLIFAATFSVDMRFAAIATLSGVAIVQTESGKIIKRLNSGLEVSPRVLKFSHDASKVSGVTAWGDVVTWDIASERLLAKSLYKVGSSTELVAGVSSDLNTLVIQGHFADSVLQIYKMPSIQE